MRHKAIALIAAATIMGMPCIGLASEETSQKEEAKAEKQAKPGTSTRQFAAIYIPPAKAAPRRTVGGATRGGH